MPQMEWIFSRSGALCLEAAQELGESELEDNNADKVERGKNWPKTAFL